LDARCCDIVDGADQVAVCAACLATDGTGRVGSYRRPGR
jgi:hypothetical protein